MVIRELKGYNSLKALNVFHTLMLGLKMLPAYQGMAYEDFFARIEAMQPGEQETFIREATLFVNLERDDVESLCCFVSDPNGVAYSKENLKSMGPDQIFEMIVAVCCEVAKIKITLVSESEKKN